MFERQTGPSGERSRTGERRRWRRHLAAALVVAIGGSTIALDTPASAEPTMATTTTTDVFPVGSQPAGAVAVVPVRLEAVFMATITTVTGTARPRGTVTFAGCFSPDALPTACDSSTWEVYRTTDVRTGGAPGTTTAAVQLKPKQTGWYELHSLYSGSALHQPSEGVLRVRVVGITPGMEPTLGGTGDALRVTVHVNGSEHAPAPTGRITVYFCHWTDDPQPCRPSLGRKVGPRRYRPGLHGAGAGDMNIDLPIWTTGSYTALVTYSGDENYARRTVAAGGTVTTSREALRWRTVSVTPSTKPGRPIAISVEPFLLRCATGSITVTRDIDGDGVGDRRVGSAAFNKRTRTATVRWVPTRVGVHHFIVDYPANAACAGGTIEVVGAAGTPDDEVIATATLMFTTDGPVTFAVVADTSGPEPTGVLGGVDGSTLYRGTVDEAVMPDCADRCAVLSGDVRIGVRRRTGVHIMSDAPFSLGLTDRPDGTPDRLWLDPQSASNGWTGTVPRRTLGGAILVR